MNAFKEFFHCAFLGLGLKKDVNNERDFHTGWAGGTFVFIVLCVVFLFAHLLGATAQTYEVGTPEYYQALGIEPKEVEATGCEYTPIENIFGEPKHFTTEDNVDFLFVNRTITSSFPSNDPKHQLTVLGKIDSQKMRCDIEGLPEEVVVDVYQAKDNAGGFVAVKVLLNADTTEMTMQLAYRNYNYFYNTKSTPIPEEPFDILANLEELGHLHDGNFGSDYTDEEVYEFLRECGFDNPQVVLKFMLHDLFYNESFGVNNKPQKWQIR